MPSPNLRIISVALTHLFIYIIFAILDTKTGTFSLLELNHMILYLLYYHYIIFVTTFIPTDDKEYEFA